MNDPYSVLGLSPNASDDEVKQASRELARKYHPDNYQNNPLADLAEEKKKEINEAYEIITRSRSGGSQARGYGGGYQQQYGYQQQQHGYQQQQQYGYQQQSTGDVLFARVRQCINRGEINQAESLLRSSENKSAEWYFLYGHVAYQKGWLDEATTYFQTACSMDPGNTEDRQALARMQRGGMGGYRPAGYTATNCDPCTTYMCISCLTPWGGPCC